MTPSHKYRIGTLQKGLYDVRVFHKHRPVATHARIIDQRDAKSTLAGHHQQPMARKTAQRSAPLMRQLTGHSRALDVYVATMAARHSGAVTKKLKRLLAIKRDYPKNPFEKAVARAVQYGVYDLNRLENIILSCVAGDFFDLEDHDNQ